mmetsp:Transcript_42531/g.83436  ORF Transcript_42531/g.83436 Transcript_42531/m.83436 type:complete len:169 (-) Transcript_42531:119-625(-)
MSFAAAVAETVSQQRSQLKADHFLAWIAAPRDAAGKIKGYLGIWDSNWEAGGSNVKVSRRRWQLRPRIVYLPLTQQGTGKMTVKATSLQAYVQALATLPVPTDTLDTSTALEASRGDLIRFLRDVWHVGPASLQQLQQWDKELQECNQNLTKFCEQYKPPSNLKSEPL